MLGGFTRSLSALVHFTLHKGAAVDSVVYISTITIDLLWVGAVGTNLSSIGVGWVD